MSKEVRHYVTPDSSSVRAVSYYNKVLVVQYHTQPDDEAYAYFEVEKKKYTDVCECDSVGGYINSNIRGQYESEKIKITANTATII
jgi:hypothetical protein